MNDDDARLIRSSSLMGLGTIISRVTGLVRNLLLVAVFTTVVRSKGTENKKRAPKNSELFFILL